MARTHVVISDDLVEAIDARVGQRGRSRFFEEAAREKLRRLALEESLRSTSGIVDPARYPQWRDATTTREWVRKTRETEGPPQR